MLRSLIEMNERNDLFKFLYYKIFKPKLCFSEEDITNYYIYYKTEQPFVSYKTSEYDDPINEAFNSWSESGELEYLIHYTNNCIIEPYRGWVLNGENKILKESLPYGELESTEKPHYIYYKKKKYLDLECAVSIRYNWFNYWHFYNDVIGQVYFLEKNKFDKTIPLVIPKKALELPYVKDFLETEFAKKWQWLYQDTDIYFRLKSVYLCKSIPNIKYQFIFANNIFSAKTFKNTSSKRIFLQRDKKRGRYISNMDELVPILKEHYFEIVDADALTLKQQMALFSSAEIIMGPHGAGLTNILYRYPSGCTLIEMFPSNFIPAHYYWLAKELGFFYEPILGSTISDNGFQVNCFALQKSLRKVLSD